MNEGVKVKYGDIAPEAKENFTYTATNSEPFVNMAQFQQYNLDFPNYGNPCDYGSVLLNNQSVPFPKYPESSNMGYWSNIISDENGDFANDIVFTFTSSGQYSSQGFTITFDTYNNIYCTDLSITWYRNNQQIATESFQPDSAFYFCQKNVENYDKIVMTFKKINMPYNRLKIRTIDFGYGAYFYGDELKNVSCIHEINPISAELPINTIDFTLRSKGGFDYSFQNKQPLEVYFNGKLQDVSFVNKSQRTSKTTWKIQSEDYIGQLSKLAFVGGMYENQNAKELLIKIFTQAKIPYEISDSLATEKITGLIPMSTCREAIRQICFAIGAICTTAYSDKVKIIKLNNEETQKVTLNRIRQGQSFDESDRITAVNLTAHSYIKSTETVELYKAADSGIGDEILVQFSDPIYDLNISNGEILKNADNTPKSSATYAIIKANANCVLTGKKYTDTTTIYTKRNPIVSALDLENVSEITDATLVNNTNAQTILNRAYDFLTKRTTTKLKIYESFHYATWGQTWGTFKWGGKEYDKAVKVGDIITTETEYKGDITGRILSERYNLNGNIIVKECEMV